MKRLMWIFCCFLVMPVLFAGTVPEPIGRVVGVQGDVRATAPGGPVRRLAVKDALYARDTITTGPDARLQVLFNDNSLFSQGENSEVVLEDYIYDPSRRENNSFFLRIIRGISRVVTGRITDLNPERFKVKTSRATIGIRGCELGFNVQPGFDQIMIIRVPPGRRIIVHNDLPGAPAASAELVVYHPRVVTIGEDGRMTDEALQSARLRRLSTETTPAVVPATDSPPAPDAPDPAPAPDAEDTVGLLFPLDPFLQDVLPPALETETSWLDLPPEPSTPGSPSSRSLQGGGLGALYALTTVQTLNELHYYKLISGFISEDLTSVDFSDTILDRNGVVLGVQTVSLSDIPLARFGGTASYEGYRETEVRPGVFVANDNLQQFVRHVDENNPAVRLTFWGFSSDSYGTRLPASQLLTYDISDVTYPDERGIVMGSEVYPLTLRVNTRTGSYAEYKGSTAMVYGRIEDLSFFGQFAQGVGFAGQNAAGQQAPAPDGVSFAGFRLAAADQMVEAGHREYYGYAAGYAVPVAPPVSATRALMSADMITDLPSENEQRVHVTLDKDAYQANLNTAITLYENPAVPSGSDLHLDAPQTSEYIMSDDFAAQYRAPGREIELHNRRGGEDWVWGEWNGESVNAVSGQREAVDGAYTAGRTLTPLEFTDLVNGAAGYNLSTPAATPGRAVAFVQWASGQEKISGTAILNVTIPGGGTPAQWSGNFNLGSPGVTHLSAAVMPTPISANGHLTGMPSGGYVLNAGGNTYDSTTFNASRPQGFTGSLVGPGTGARPVTGAIGSGQFSHADGTTVTLTYGSDLEP